jgi:hypothetical protein
MKRFKKLFKAVFIIAHVLSILATVCIASVLLYVLYLLYYGSKIPAVLACATTILDPLCFTANILIPFGIVVQIVMLAFAILKQYRLMVVSLINSASFLVLSGMTIAVGINYCMARLEGFSFCSLVWWL